MRMFLILAVSVVLTASAAEAQTRRPAAGRVKTTPAKTTSAARGTLDKGSVSGRTYTNGQLGFSVRFPDTWLMGDDEFFTYMKSKGYDLMPKPPKAATPATQAKVNAAFNRLTILITAFRSMPGTPENAVLRVAAEDISKLNTTRPVNDAVDYVDLMRSQMGGMTMPADYKYSETQAEKLGARQFAYIDTSDKQGKTRMYVTVSRGYAVLFSLNYTADDDLATFREIMATANFASK
jgi:hypothetical protein